MIKALSASILTAMVVISTTVAVGFVVVSPIDASAAGQDLLAERIDQAFAAADGISTTEVLTYHEAPPVDCSAAVWPHIDASCLANGDAARSGVIRIVY